MWNPTNFTFKTFFFFLIIFSTAASGQLTVDALDKSFEKIFSLENLTPLTPDPAHFGGHRPFYNAFMIFGDGNYQQIRDQIKPGVGVNHTFTHNYFNSKNDYAAVMILIDRKTSDEPPEETQFILPDDGTGTNGTIPVTSDQSEQNRVLIGPAPLNPPLISPSTPTKRIAFEFSHSWIDSGLEKYYLSSNKLSAFPIAYTPGQSGLLMFFYNDPSSKRNFTYLKDYKPTDPPFTNSYGQSLPLPFGTYFPNYNNSQISKNKAQAIDQVDFSFYAPSTMTLFKHILPHEITADEVVDYKFRVNQELRLFHLLKSEDLEENKDYYFMATLYGNPSTNSVPISDNLNYTEIRNILDVFGQPAPLDEFNNRPFIDAQFMAIKNGEPDDPNWLKIENICKCDSEGNYIVDFNLQFCNVSKTPATGAYVILKELEEIFSCFKLKEVKPGAQECLVKKECSTTCDYNFSETSTPGKAFSNGGPDHEFCINFQDGFELIDSSCANITFSASIKENDLEILTERSVWRYCVHLKNDGVLSEQELCMDSDVLNKVKFTYGKKDDQYYSSKQQFYANGIWTDRNKTCLDKVINDNTCCQKPFCNSWWCRLGIVLVVFVLVFWFFGRKKK